MPPNFVIRQELTQTEFPAAILQIYWSSHRLRVYVLILIGLALLSQGLGYLTTPQSFSALDLLPVLVPILIVMAIFACLITGFSV